MAATIIREAEFHLNYAGPIVVDLSCYTIAFELATDVETIDVGTFCNPTASTFGRASNTASVTMLWEPALYAALEPHIGDPCLVAFAPDANNPTDYIRFNSRVAAQPWGRFEIGQRVEVELQLAVLDNPTWNEGTTTIFDLRYPDQQPVEPAVEPQADKPEA